MKEHPILFNAEMVRAILAGMKTQTRRPIKPQWPKDAEPKEHSQVPGYWIAYTHDGKLMNGFQGSRKNDCGIYCPYQVGQRLWVRETWLSVNSQFPRNRVAYKADMMSYGIADYMDLESEVFIPDAKVFPEPFVKRTAHKWRPAIHMPRWASRITLEITAIRAERVQSISEDDAIAEGVTLEPHGMRSEVRGWFAELWDSIYGKGSDAWANNPYVWVVEFKRVTA